MSNPKIVCMGDSLTEGYMIDLSQRWSEWLKKSLGMEIINSGISGDTTGGMLSRFKPMVIDHEPTHVIIMGGTNDVSLNIPDEQILANIYAMTRQAKHYGIQSIIGIPTPYFYEDTPMGKSFFLESQRLSERIAEYSDKLREFVKEDGQPMIDFSQGLTPELFLEDGVHPNEEGHAQMAETAKAALVEILKLNT